jgi:hypothetical protein
LDISSKILGKVQWFEPVIFAQNHDFYRQTLSLYGKIASLCGVRNYEQGSLL